MINWLIEQQLVLSLVLLSLLLLEAKALPRLGAKAIYCMWWLLPLVLIANNLPQNVIAVENNSLYRYVVALGAQSQSLQFHVNWAWVWILGCSGILALGVMAQFKINRLSRDGSRQITLNMPLPRTLSVRSNNRLSGPVLTGLLKPTLLLPEGFESQFSARQQALMIKHELVHFHRGDNLYNLAALIFVAVFWFNPLTWLAYRAFRRSQELACDAAVLEHSSKQDKISYSKALVQCAERSLHSFSIYSPYGEKHTMFKRIKTIQNPVKIKPALIGLSLVLSSSMLASVAFANLAEQMQKVDLGPQAVPVKRIEPKYPKEAVKNNQEGAVILGFDISKNGTTENIKVIESFPKQVFDRNAITALKQWTYKPRIQGGQAMSQTGLKVQLDFRLGPDTDNQTAMQTKIEKIKVTN